MILAAVFALMGSTSDVDAYVHRQMKTWHIPGVSVGVVKDGKVVLAKGYGFANLETRTPAGPDTLYGILSVGKEFTAAGVMTLVDANRVSLDSSISTYLPDVPATWRPITIRQLLSHTSGLEDYVEAPGFFDSPANPATPEALLHPVATLPLLFPPGSKYKYSNTDYYVLGQLIEKVSGLPFEDWIRERLFRPAGMPGTRMDDLRAVIPGRAMGYHWTRRGAGGVLQNAMTIDPTRKWAAGGYISSVKDLIAWDAALRDNRLLRLGLRALMESPARLTDGTAAPYGLGEELSTVHGQRVVGHQGGGMAFNATISRFVDSGLTVIVLCNQTSAPSQMMASQIAAFYLPALREKVVGDPSPATTAWLRQVLIDAAIGKVDPDRFATTATSTMDFVRKAGPRFLAPFGSLQRLEFLEEKRQGASRILRYRAIFEKGELVWTFTLDEKGKLVSLEPEG